MRWLDRFSTIVMIPSMQSMASFRFDSSLCGMQCGLCLCPIDVFVCRRDAE